MSQAVIILVGFSRSGKTTLAYKIRERFASHAFHILSGDPIHVYLNTQFPYFADDSTVFGHAFWARRAVTLDIQLLLLQTFLGLGLSVIIDLANLRRAERQRIAAAVRKVRPSARIAIISLQISEQELLRQIANTEREKAAKKGRKPAYLDLYQVIEKPLLEWPLPDEADQVLHTTWEREAETLNDLDPFLCGSNSER